MENNSKKTEMKFMMKLNADSIWEVFAIVQLNFFAFSVLSKNLKVKIYETHNFTLFHTRVCPKVSGLS
jgi:hypothetical protein